MNRQEIKDLLPDLSDTDIDDVMSHPCFGNRFQVEHPDPDLLAKSVVDNLAVTQNFCKLYSAVAARRPVNVVQQRECNPDEGIVENTRDRKRLKANFF